MENLSCRNGVYYFRATVPCDLLQHFPRPEIRKSLKTKSLRDAKVLLRPLQARTETLFTLLRAAMLHPEIIKNLVADYLRGALDDLDQSALTVVSDKSVLRQLQETENKAAIWDSLALYTQTQLRVNDYTSVIPIAEDMAKVFDTPLHSVNRVGTEFMLLCRELLKVHAAIFTAQAKHCRGDYGGDQLLLNQYPVKPPMQESEQEEPGKSLSEVAAAYTDQSKFDSKAVNTITNDSGDFRFIVRWMGDKPINYITPDDVIAFRKLIRKLPSDVNSTKSPLRDMTGDELNKLPDAPEDKRYKPLTINKFEGALSKLFSYAIEAKYITHSPMPKKPRTATRALQKVKETARNKFSPEQLQQLFNMPMYTTKRKLYMLKKPLDYWMPLIALLIGMRPPDEICQLQVAHIFEDKDTGIPCILCVGEGDEIAKNKGHRDRVIPIHPDLIKMGFLDYVDKRRAEGAQMLWEQVRRASKGWGAAAGARANRKIKKYVVKDRKLVLYSLRHNFGRAINSAGLIGGIEKILLGHIVMDAALLYLGENEVKVKLGWLRQLDFGVDLSHLMTPIPK